jgi:hypothetical protein
MGTPVTISHEGRQTTKHDNEMFRLTFDDLLIHSIEQLCIRGLIIDPVSRPLYTIIDP